MVDTERIPENALHQGLGYTWRQTLKEVEVYVPLVANTKARELSVVLQSDKVSIKYKNQDISTPILLEGIFFNRIKPDDSMWSIESGQLVLNLEKFSPIEWWDTVIQGHPTIDTTKIDPENSSLKDLEPDARSMVEKMMWEQRQRNQNLVTEDENKKQQVLENFKRMHPEMDFSNTKIH